MEMNQTPKRLSLLLSARRNARITVIAVALLSFTTSFANSTAAQTDAARDGAKREPSISAEVIGE